MVIHLDLMPSTGEITIATDSKTSTTTVALAPRKEIEQAKTSNFHDVYGNDRRRPSLCSKVELATWLEPLAREYVSLLRNCASKFPHPSFRYILMDDRQTKRTFRMLCEVGKWRKGGNVTSCRTDTVNHDHPSLSLLHNTNDRSHGANQGVWA